MTERWNQRMVIFDEYTSVDEYTGVGELGIYFEYNCSIPILYFKTYGGD